jgi:hypothetical protein
MKDDECNYSHSKLEQKSFLTTTASLKTFGPAISGTGYGVSKPLEISGSLPSMPISSQLNNKELEQRMVRIESRLVQLMLHMGLDPYNKVYE